MGPLWSVHSKFLWKIERLSLEGDLQPGPPAPFDPTPALARVAHTIDGGHALRTWASNSASTRNARHAFPVKEVVNPLSAPLAPSSVLEMCVNYTLDALVHELARDRLAYITRQRAILRADQALLRFGC